MENKYSLDKYLARSFNLNLNHQRLPLETEAFVTDWQTKANLPVVELLEAAFSIKSYFFPWERPEQISLSFTQTLGGVLPVLRTESHNDFCLLNGLCNGSLKPEKYPPTVNAVAMRPRAKALAGHRLLVLNKAPYSNISANQLSLETEEWLKRSDKLRLRHECAHYECLRLWGSMQQHVLDELVADSLGQLAAFGNFSAARQRLFFGLHKDTSICTGRLSFYCAKLNEDDKKLLYNIVNKALDKLETILNEQQHEGASEYELLRKLCSINLQSK